jgi:hypothetical protein
MSSKPPGTPYHGNPPTAPQIEDYSKIWQRDRLHPISNDLPDAWKRRYENLASPLGRNKRSKDY